VGHHSSQVKSYPNNYNMRVRQQDEVNPTNQEWRDPPVDKLRDHNSQHRLNPGSSKDRRSCIWLSSFTKRHVYADNLDVSQLTDSQSQPGPLIDSVKKRKKRSLSYVRIHGQMKRRHLYRVSKMEYIINLVLGGYALLI
jgi:hypothetical protein